jgi:hypothetical protein
MRPFDWQTDVITSRTFTYDPGRSHSSHSDRYGYTYVSESTRWIGDGTTIRSALYQLTEDELKICMLHQPMLIDIIVWIMQVREQIKEEGEQL